MAKHMYERTLIACVASLVAACTTSGGPIERQEVEPQEVEHHEVAAAKAALTNAPAWAGAWQQRTGTGTMQLTCDHPLPVTAEEGEAEPIVITPGAGETFTLDLGGCVLPFQVSGNVATYSGSVRCADLGPDGYVGETTYSTATLTRRADGNLDGRVTAQVAFGPKLCEVTRAGIYESVPLPL